jgi:sugar (pentulose or hexulose) kinase
LQLELGLVDLSTGFWSSELLKFFGIEAQLLYFPRITVTPEQLGCISISGSLLPVFGGFGDLQAAAAGVGFPDVAGIFINLGTGSQILVSGKKEVSNSLERRSSVSGEIVAAITHIPSGRALNVFASLFDECAQASGGEPFFWRIFTALDATEVLGAALTVDLNVFASAWRFNQGGAILGIREGGSSLQQVIAGIARSWLQQYAEAAAIADPMYEHKVFVVAGGLSRRASFVLPVLESMLKRKGVVAGNALDEETLSGLLVSARSAHKT